MQAVILAGGKGTRLQNILKGKPKCLAPVGESTILEHQIKEISKSKIKDILIVCFYGYKQVDEYINLIKQKYPKINISLFVENYPGGTGGALHAAYKLLNEDFILIMGDLFISLNLEKIYDFSRKIHSDALLVCKYTDHPEDSDLIGLTSNNCVKDFFLRDENRNQIMNGKIPPIGNSGVFYFQKKFINFFCEKSCDIHDVIYSALKNKKSNSFSVHYYFTSEFIKDLGSEKRLNEISKLNLLPYQQNSNSKSPAVFLDKDNTLIKDPENKNPKNIPIDFLNHNLIKLLAKLNKTHRIFITTNQPALAKGFFKEDDLINHLFTLGSSLYKNKVNLSGFYFCPHHPEKGFKGEIRELKVDCDCRKPNIGMCKKICEDFNIDLENSIVIGDSFRDQEMARNFGIKFLNVQDI